MLVMRSPAMLLATTLLALADHERLDAPVLLDGADSELQGTWEVVDVRRSGITDTSQIGARLTFAGNRVSLSRIIALNEPVDSPKTGFGFPSMALPQGWEASHYAPTAPFT